MSSITCINQRSLISSKFYFESKLRLIESYHFNIKHFHGDELHDLLQSCVISVRELLNDFCGVIEKVKNGKYVHMNTYDLNNLIEHPRLCLEMNIETIIDEVLEQNFSDDNLYLELKTRVLSIFKLDQA